MFDIALYNSFMIWKSLTGKKESFTEFPLNFVDHLQNMLPQYPSCERPSIGSIPATSRQTVGTFYNKDTTYFFKSKSY